MPRDHGTSGQAEGTFYSGHARNERNYSAAREADGGIHTQGRHRVLYYRGGAGRDGERDEADKVY